MKKLLFPILFAALLGAPAAARAEAPPLFAPAPPEPAAAALLESYLPLLAAGQFEQALALNDLRGMRQYLLERRLAELRERNPELTAKEIDELSAQLQTTDLNPARLQDILLDVMRHSGFEGMTWRIQGFAPAPGGAGGFLASIDARTANGQEKPVLLGLKKLGDQWLVAPEIVEELGRQVVVPASPSQPPPDEVVATVNTFWQHWQTGEFNEAYALFAEEYRQKIPLLAFLQQAQDFVAQAGVPTSWNIVQCRPLAPGTLGLGVHVQGSIALKPTIMIFRQTGGTWVLLDSQYQMPAPAANPPPTAAPPPTSAFHTDFRTDLKTPVAATSTIPMRVAPPPAAGKPAKPDAPIGPAAR